MRLVLSGLFVALSVTVRVAVRVPVAVGLNVTLIVQDRKSVVQGQRVLVCVRAPLLVPVTARLVLLNAFVLPVWRVFGRVALLVVVMLLLNCRRAGAELTAVAPEPVRLVLCGLFVALSVTVRVAVRVPVAVGLNVTLIV